MSKRDVGWILETEWASNSGLQKRRERFESYGQALAAADGYEPNLELATTHIFKERKSRKKSPRR